MRPQAADALDRLFANLAALPKPELEAPQSRRSVVRHLDEPLPDGFMQDGQVSLRLASPVIVADVYGACILVKQCGLCARVDMQRAVDEWMDGDVVCIESGKRIVLLLKQLVDTGRVFTISYGNGVA